MTQKILDCEAPKLSSSFSFWVPSSRNINIFFWVIAYTCKKNTRTVSFKCFQLASLMRIKARFYMCALYGLLFRLRVQYSFSRNKPNCTNQHFSFGTNLSYRSAEDLQYVPLGRHCFGIWAICFWEFSNVNYYYSHYKLYYIYICT